MLPNAAVYEWDAWDGYLLSHLLPDALRIPATAFDSSREILEKTPSGTTHFVFHIDCTDRRRFPNDRDRLLEGLTARRIGSVNSRLVNSSKQWIQQVCRSLGLRKTAAEKGGDPSQCVIVKTNQNYAGMRERRLLASERRNLGIDAPAGRIDGPLVYPIMMLSEVPAEWWSDASLCVERFIGNSTGKWLRAYFFMQRVILTELASDDPIKKLDNSRTKNQYQATTTNGELNIPQAAPPALLIALSELLKFANATRFEFGAIDMVCNDADEAFIIDVNPTPIWKPAVAEVASYLKL
jgi:hypothetical protein